MAILLDDALLQQCGDHLLGLALLLLLSLDLGILLNDLIEHLELLLNSRCLGLGSKLIVLDLLLGPSPLTADLHQVSSCASRLYRITNKE